MPTPLDFSLIEASIDKNDSMTNIIFGMFKLDAEDIYKNIYVSRVDLYSCWNWYYMGFMKADIQREVEHEEICSV